MSKHRVLKWWGRSTRKKWRHYKRQLKRQKINPDYYPAPYKIALILGKLPKDNGFIIPILYKSE